VNNFSTT